MADENNGFGVMRSKRVGKIRFVDANVGVPVRAILLGSASSWTLLVEIRADRTYYDANPVSILCFP